MSDSPMNYTGDVVFNSETIREHLARVDRIEARQRDYGMHDPDCLRRASEIAQRYTGAHVVPQECNCWLSE